ncbi:hypothetical protein AB837_00555 [bacterium AB1]|nr:hypothetical protein AB837_00555 [bacterium AB1]
MFRIECKKILQLIEGAGVIGFISQNFLTFKKKVSPLLILDFDNVDSLEKYKDALKVVDDEEIYSSLVKYADEVIEYEKLNTEELLQLENKKKLEAIISYNTCLIETHIKLDNTLRVSDDFFRYLRCDYKSKMLLYKPFVDKVDMLMTMLLTICENTKRIVEEQTSLII